MRRSGARCLGVAVALLALAGCGGAGSSADNSAQPLAAAEAPSPDQPIQTPTATPTPAPAGADNPADVMAGDGATLSSTPYSGSSATGQTLPGDVAGASDHPALPRYEGSTIHGYDRKAYDQVRFLVRPVPPCCRDDEATAIGEGQLIDIDYDAPAGRSALEIFRNYQKLLADGGFKTVFTCELDACKGAPERIARQIHRRASSFGEQRYIAAYRPADGLRVSVAVIAKSDRQGRVPYELVVLEPKAMQQKISVVSAQGIARDVEASGRAVLYAVEFDLDKATLRPASDAQLKEIAGWLGAGAGKVLVVGHTDAKGGYGYNVGLAQRRAQAVVDALVTRFGIDKARLTPVGVGMAAPVASNRTEPGAAKNRRVEIVEIP